MRGVNKISCGLALGVFLLSASSLAAVQAAELYIFPSFMESAPEQKLIFDLRIDTQGETVNALTVTGVVQGGVQLIGADFSGSQFSIFPEQPVIDAARKTFTFTAAEPNGFKGGGVIGRLMLQTNKDGGGAGVHITIDSSKVYLNTPTPTLAGLTVQNSAITINPAEAASISSKSHPLIGTWSLERNAQFHWTVRGAEKYSYILSHLATDKPDTVSDAPVGDITYNNLDEGIYYFSLCEIQNTVCGPIARYPIFIDITPPEWVSLLPSSGTPDTANKPYVSFLAKDVLSGVVDYRVSTNNGPYRSAMSSYILDSDFRGEVTIEAVDRAGNSSRKTIRLGALPETTSWQSRALPIFIALGTLGILVGILALRKRRK